MTENKNIKIAECTKRKCYFSEWYYKHQTPKAFEDCEDFWNNHNCPFCGGYIKIKFAD